MAAFDRETYGCVGGGVGLGFGNCYKEFPGGMEGFARFLADGNEQSARGRAIAEECAAWLRGQMRKDFLHGERYRKDAGLVEGFVRDLPMTDIPAKYVVFKPLAQVAAGETPVAVIFLANPDQMSALVVLANYGRPDNENAIIPHAAGCQTLGIYAYREAASVRPRAIVGLNDISARKHLRKLGKDLVTVTLPYQLFREMEGNVAGSFLEEAAWQELVREG